MCLAGAGSALLTWQAPLSLLPAPSISSRGPLAQAGKGRARYRGRLSQQRFFHPEGASHSAGEETLIFLAVSGRWGVPQTHTGRFYHRLSSKPDTVSLQSGVSEEGSKFTVTTVQ